MNTTTPLPRSPLAASSALITGAASGIGRATAELLWERGQHHLLLFDLSAPALAELRASLESRPTAGQRCVTVVGDVRDDAAQIRAFAAAEALAPLHLAVVNAGVGGRGDFLAADDADNGDVRRVVDVDLTAALLGVKLAARAMLKRQQKQQHPSAPASASIVCVASAAGYFPTPAGVVYAAAKAGLLHACRSLSPRLAAKGIRLTAVCPQYIHTPLVDALVASGAARAMMGPLYGKPLLTPRQAAEVICGPQTTAPLSKVEVEEAVARGPYGGGALGSGVLLLLQDGRVFDPFRKRGGGGSSSVGSRPTPPPPMPSPAGRSVPPLLRFSPSACRAFAAASLRSLPQTYRKLAVRELSTDFRRAAQVQEVPLPSPSALKPGEVLVRRLYAGVNASDVNWTSGRYHGSKRRAEAALPYDAGFESVGVVVAVGGGSSSPSSSSSSASFAPGDAVATMESGFSEWAVVPARRCLRVPSPTPEAVALLTSGMTASIALERSAGVRLPARYGFPGPDNGGNGGPPSVAVDSTYSTSPAPRVAIVTAAAGGTGQFAVQLLRAAGGWKVVATCSGGDDGPKARLLRRLGADAIVDYRAAAADVAGGGLRGALRRACARVRGGEGAGKEKEEAGADLIYESVGGDTFDACVDALADRSVLVVIGMMDSYGSGWKPRSISGLPEKLLWKSAAVSGFFLLRHASLWAPHLRALAAMAAAGDLEVAVDGEVGGGQTPYVGIEAVADAVDRLQGGRSSGKVVVQLGRELPAATEGAAEPRSRL